MRIPRNAHIALVLCAGLVLASCGGGDVATSSTPTAPSSSLENTTYPTSTIQSVTRASQTNAAAQAPIQDNSYNAVELPTNTTPSNTTGKFINNSLQVIQSSADLPATDASYLTQSTRKATIWQNGAYSTLDMYYRPPPEYTTPSAGYSTQTAAINNNGIAAAYASISSLPFSSPDFFRVDGPSSPFALTMGGATPVVQPFSTYATAEAINDNNQIAGLITPRRPIGDRSSIQPKVGYITTNGVMTTFGSFGGPGRFTLTSIAGINNNGTVIILSEDVVSGVNGYVYRAGALSTLTAQGRAFSPVAITDQEEVFGYYADSSGRRQCGVLTTTAFTNLSSFLPSLGYLINGNDTNCQGHMNNNGLVAIAAQAALTNDKTILLIDTRTGITRDLRPSLDGAFDRLRWGVGEFLSDQATYVVRSISDNGDILINKCLPDDTNTCISFILTRTPPPIFLDPVALPGSSLKSLLEGNTVTKDTARLATGGRPVKGVAADGVAQVVLKIPVTTPGERFTVKIKDGQCATSGPACTDSYGRIVDLSNQTAAIYTNAVVNSAAALNSPDGKFAYVGYRAPSDFVRTDGSGSADLTKAGRLITLQITSSKNVSRDIEVQVVRPPTLLVHGFNTDAAQAWETLNLNSAANHVLSVYSIDYGQPLYKEIDYTCGRGSVCIRQYAPTTEIDIISTTPALSLDDLKQKVRRSHLGFSYNAKFFGSTAAKVLNRYSAGENAAGLPLAVTAVDVIAHSMGGLVARYASSLQEYTQDNFSKGYIHKMITLGTPHYGTPQAILSTHEKSECSRSKALGAGSVSIISATIKYGDSTLDIPGAAGEMRGNGVSIQNESSDALRVVNNSSARIPIAALAGYIDPIKSLINFAAVPIILKAACPESDPLARRLTSELFDTTFSPDITIVDPDPNSSKLGLGGRESDGSVPLSSALMNSSITEGFFCNSWQCLQSYTHSTGIAIFFKRTPFSDINYLQDGSAAAVGQLIRLLNTSPTNAAIWKR